MSKPQINRTKKMMTTTIPHSIFQSIEQIAEEMGVNKNKVIEQAVLVLEKTRKANKRDHKKTPSANWGFSSFVSDQRIEVFYVNLE